MALHFTKSSSDQVHPLREDGSQVTRGSTGPWAHGSKLSSPMAVRNSRPTVRMRIRGLVRIVLKLRLYLGKIRAVIGGPRGSFISWRAERYSIPFHSHSLRFSISVCFCFYYALLLLLPCFCLAFAFDGTSAATRRRCCVHFAPGATHLGRAAKRQSFGPLAVWIWLFFCFCHRRCSAHGDRDAGVGGSETRPFKI